METDKVLLTIAVVAVAVSVIGLVFTYNTISGFKLWLTGLATDTATANVTITSSEAINFTTDNINWGSGTVNGGETNATLDTASGTVTGGTWTAVSQGFILENIGNVNVTLDLATDKDASTFIGGTSPLYQFNVTNNEAGSCPSANQSITFGAYYDVNTTSPGTRVCDNFQFTDASDTLRIDIKVVIPADAIPEAKGSIMTATATAV